MNIERARTLYFRGMRWSLETERRARAVGALSAEARIVMEDRRAASVPLAARLRVDYRTPWADVRDVMTALRAPPASIANVHWAVASPEPHAWVGSRIEMEPASERIDPAAQVAITLGGSSGSDDADVAPVLRIGEEPFTFAAGDPYAAGAANDLANRNWRAISARLEVAKAGGTRAAVLTIADRVPWAYVAMTMGTLLDAGIDRVHMGEMGYRLSTPSARSVPWHAGDRDPRDWHPALALGVGVSIALAMFGLGAWNGRRRGRRPLRHGGVREPGRETRARR